MAISSTSSAVALSLLSYYNGSSTSASDTLASLTSSSNSSTTTKTVAKMAPWDSSAPKTATDKLASSTLNASSLFSGGLGKGAGSGVNDKNDRELFLLYNAVDKLRALAETAASKTMSESLRTKIQGRIERGLAEIETQANKNGLDGATLISGKKYSTIKSDQLGAKDKTSFQTAALATGDETTIPSQFLGDVKFTVTAKIDNETKNITIDLNGMGTTNRTVGNVADYVNEQLMAAGIESRFSRTESTKTSDVSKTLTYTQQHLKVSVASGETITFGAVAGDTETSVYVAGGTTADKIKQSLITKIDVSDNGDLEKISTKDFTATNGATIRAMTRDKDGNIYVVANVSGTFGNNTSKDTTDVALQKIDSTGNVVWSRALGSAETASGFSIAVSDDGTVAIAGSVDGLGDSQKSTKGSGIDSFVATFTDEGKDLWYYQKGATGTDYATDIKFDDIGNLIVLGQTSNTINGTDVYGKNDVYVQSFDIDGSVNYTKSLGTEDDDSAIGLQISGNQVLIAWNTATEGHISRINSETGDFAAADYLTASNGIQKMSAFNIDGDGNVIIAGNSQGNTISDEIKGINLLTSAVTFSANTNGNPIRSIDIGGGMVNVAIEGVAMDNAKDTKALQTTLKGYNLSDGTEKYSIDVLGEANQKVSVIATEGQSKSLQALGLPQGELSFDNSKSLTDLTGLRAGDYFYISVNGGTDRKITIAQNETMQTLTDKVKKYASRGANVTLGTSDGAKYMSMTPKSGFTVELKAGEGGANALKQLGLEEGVLITTTTTTNSRSSNISTKPVVALELPSSVDVSDATKAKSLKDSLTSVLSRIRTGYRAISTDPTMVELRKSTAAGATSSANSAAVASYNAKTAAYSAALAKLTA